MAHPVELLPWYRNGTLPPAERASVDEHLRTCADCRAELASLAEVREQVQAAMQSQAAPSAHARRRVMANIARARSGEAAPRQAAARPAMLDSIAEAFRSLMAPKWVPTAAVMLIALQGGVLLWSTQRPEQAAQPQVASRSLATPTARIRVLFAANATQDSVRALLTEVRGRIVDGPDANGAYVVEVLAADPARAAQKVEMLRARTDLVREAQGIAQ